jgi:sugar phosphate permease
VESLLLLLTNATPYFAFVLLLSNVFSTKLQSIGFLLTGTLFILCGMIISSSSSSSSGSDDESKTKTYIMVSMYLLSSFIGQLGPNCTTFIIPTEIFPTEQRTYAHGICAASGKVGALIAAIIFHFISSPTSNSGNYGNDDGGGEQEEQEQDQQQYLLFYICGYTSFVACLITICFIPETNNLNLLELDLQWNNMVYQKQQQQEEEEEEEGQQQQQYNSSYSYHYYNGPANHPDHLSLYERWIKQKQNINS